MNTPPDPPLQRFQCLQLRCDFKGDLPRRAVGNLIFAVDTAYIGMLDSDIALTAVGVTVPLLLIMVSLENIFAAGAAVLAGSQLGAKNAEEASRMVTTVIGISMIISTVSPPQMCSPFWSVCCRFRL